MEEGGASARGMPRKWENGGRGISKDWDEEGRGVPREWEAGGAQQGGDDQHQLHLDDGEEEVCPLLNIRVL